MIYLCELQGCHGDLAGDRYAPQVRNSRGKFDGPGTFGCGLMPAISSNTQIIFHLICGYVGAKKLMAMKKI
jgi:hypothetical protein